MFTSIDILNPPRFSCIYRWTNLLNGKMYIGETKNLLDRLKGYKRQHDTSHCKDYFSRAIRKYGFDKFKLEVLEVFPTGVSKDVLWMREKFWIAFFNSTHKKLGYNTCIYGNVMKGMIRPFRTRRALKKRIITEETKRKIGLANTGFKRSEELKRAMSEHRIGKPGHKHTEETKAILSQKHTGKRKDYVAKAILQIDKNTGEVIEEFDRITDAALKLTGKNNISGISLAANGKKKSAYGFFWRFKNA